MGENPKKGMNPVEISISVSMPEFDGIIHGVPVAAKHMKENGDIDFVISDADMELLKNAEPVKDYGEFSFFPVYGGKLKKYRVEIKR